MNWCLVAICGIQFIFFIWLAILTIKFNDFKDHIEYKFEQRYKLDQMYFKAFKDAVWSRFRSLDKKYKNRKVAKKKGKK